MLDAAPAFPVADVESGRAGLRRVQALARRGVRWLQARSFGFAPEQVGLAEGLRAAVAVAVFVLAACALQRPVIAWAAYSAFWTCLADPGGPDRQRLRAMGAFVLVGAVLAGLMSGLASVAGPWVTVAVLFGIVCLCGMSRLLGPDMAQAGLLANVTAVVAVDVPTAPAQALVLAGFFLGGGGLAIVLCLVVWRLHPHRPTRRAVAAVFRDLGEMTAELARAPDARGDRRLEGEHRWAVRNAIERARSKVDQFAAWRDEVPRDLTAAVEACDRIFAGLIALGHERAGGGEGAAAFPADLLDELEAALAEGGRQAARPDPDWTRVRLCAERLAACAGAAQGLAARVASAWSLALLDLAQGRAPAAGGVRQPSGAEGRRTPSSRVLASVRHALRLATAVLAAYLVAHALSLPYAYWATVAVVVVMQPYAEAAWPRVLERIVGSVVGGLAAAALPLVLTTPWELLAVVFPLAAAAIALRSVNYTLFVLFLTPLFVLVTELIAPGQGHGQGLAFARAANNVLGSLLALAGMLVLWPERAPQPWSRRLADAVEANLTYAALVAEPGVAHDRVEAARRQAGVCSSAAEDALHRMRLEGRRRQARLDEAGALLAGLRRLAGAATAAWLAADPAQAGPAAGDGARPVDAGASAALRRSGLEAVAAEVREACRAYASAAPRAGALATPCGVFLTNR